MHIFARETVIFPRETMILPRYSAQKRSNSPRESGASYRDIYMRATTFKEILDQFLEENRSEQGKMPSENEHFASQLHDFAFVLLDQPPLTFPRNNNPYSQGKVPQSTQNRVDVRPKLPIELSEKGKMALESLLRLGGTELDSGLSATVLKKVYRRLLKFYHPDHQQLAQLPEEQKRRTEQFFELRNSFLILEAELMRHSGLA